MEFTSVLRPQLIPQGLRSDGFVTPLLGWISRMLPRSVEPTLARNARANRAGAGDPTAYISIAVRDRCTSASGRFGAEKPPSKPFRPTARPKTRPALRVVHVVDGQAPDAGAGRMLISGRMADVCAELDRLAAAELRRRRA